MTKTFKQNTINPTKITVNAEGYAAALQTLNDKINAVKKDITYLDVYNIVDTVEDKDILKSKIEALVPNSSLVINKSFDMDNESYIVGDIVLKMASGKVIHIKAQPGGVFYPLQISGAKGNYNIEYSYSEKVPEEGNSTNQVGTTGENKKSIKFTGLESSSPSYIYGIWKKFTELEKTIATDLNKSVRPYFKFYINDNENYEEIFIDYTLKYSSGYWIIGGIDEGIKDLLWIKVK